MAALTKDDHLCDFGRPWQRHPEMPKVDRHVVNQLLNLKLYFSVNFKLIVLQYFIPLHDGVPVTLCRRSTSVAHVAVVFSCYPYMSDLLLSRASSSAVALALRQSSAERAQAPSTSTGLHRRISRDLSISFPSSIWRR